MGYGPTDRQTDGWTDGPMDKASYRDAWTHLKKVELIDGGNDFTMG